MSQTRRSSYLTALGSLSLGVVALVVRPRLVAALLVLAAVFIPLERWFALHRRRIFRDGWQTDLVHLFVNHVALRVLLFAVVIVVGVAARLVVPAPIRSAVASQPAWLQIAEAMVLGELGGYLGHRAAHAVPLLWRFHKVHHAITEMDWLASSHLHPFDQAFIRSCAIVPVYALGFTVTTLGAFGVVLTVHAFFLHANVRWTLGPLRWVIGTPHFHHWHHALDPEARDTNFAGLFPAVDWLFGTLHIPKRRWPAGYGIGEPEPRGYLRQLAYPLRSQATRNVDPVALEPHNPTLANGV